MPKGLETFDYGPSGFAAIILMHEKINGPVVTEFIDAICNPPPLRGVAHLQRKIEQTPAEQRDPQQVQKLQDAIAALQKKKAAMSNGALRTDFTEADAAALRPFTVARNRWHLALLLIMNPSLMKYRKFRLPQKSAAEFEMANEEPLAERLTNLLQSFSFSDSKKPTCGSAGPEATDSDEENLKTYQKQSMVNL